MDVQVPSLVRALGDKPMLNTRINYFEGRVQENKAKREQECNTQNKNEVEGAMACENKLMRTQREIVGKREKKNESIVEGH
mmetsp:Transcript_12847/g.20307  ORF Transcript_12847/g.20307 Transcript_12847/m.20307 type:complete len:81 (+) Transcript_12847:89-331(+)